MDRHTDKRDWEMYLLMVYFGSYFPDESEDEIIEGEQAATEDEESTVEFDLTSLPQAETATPINYDYDGPTGWMP